MIIILFGVELKKQGKVKSERIKSINDIDYLKTFFQIARLGNINKLPFSLSRVSYCAKWTLTVL